MTVNTINTTSGPYTGNGVASTFSYTFRVINQNDVVVFETDTNGNEVELVPGVGFTVANLGNDNGGLITRTAGALPTGYTWFIRSNYQPTQLVDFDSQAGFFPDVHEDALDKLTLLSQQGVVLDRNAFRFRPGYFGQANAIVPDPVPNRGVKWDADGLNLIPTTKDPDAESVEDVPVDDVYYLRRNRRWEASGNLATRSMTVSTADPDDAVGSDGDLWFKVVDE